jgi:cytochrome c oxidase assembly factor CtaG
MPGRPWSILLVGLVALHFFMYAPLAYLLCLLQATQNLGWSVVVSCTLLDGVRLRAASGHAWPATVDHIILVGLVVPLFVLVRPSTVAENTRSENTRSETIRRGNR